MRADRLIQIILLLQKRHMLSARELAEELCVSRRTIFRDMDTLGMMGIPIYAEQGSEGGYRLVEEYRTGLNGLTRDELHAMMAFSCPEFMTELDIGQKAKTALLKLYTTSPARPQKIYLDWTPWGYGYKPLPHLQTLYQAIQEDQRAAIHYRLWHKIDVQREVDPYGLVAKEGEWYLVYHGDGCVRHQNAADLIEVKPLNRTFQRPQDFDLEQYWKRYTTALQEEIAAQQFRVVLRVSAAVVQWLPHLIEQGELIEGADSEDRMCLALHFETFEAARKEILALGGSVEVVEPQNLRLSVQDFAKQILQVYDR